MSNYEMKEIKTVAIIGLGALGILFAHHLSKNMPKENLRIIADSQRIEKYKKDQVYCNGELCSFNYTAPGRTTEVELFSGTVLELGKKYEVDTPVNRYLYLWAQEGR